MLDLGVDLPDLSGIGLGGCVHQEEQQQRTGLCGSAMNWKLNFRTLHLD